MKLSVKLLQQIKMYYDIGCPATWASLKIIKKDFNLEEIDFRPVWDFKIDLKRNQQLAELLENGKEAERVEKNRMKEVPEILQPELRENWKEIYRESHNHSSILAMLFLTAIREHFPQLYVPSIYKVGSRLWEEALPVHKGCYLSTCAREIGLQFKDSEEIISRLSHRNYRKLLTDFSNEAVELGAVESPFFIDTSTSPPLIFKDAVSLVKQSFEIPHDVVV